MLDSILYSIIAAFIAWEGIAHFILHNKSGHTASNRILYIETHDPTKWTVRAIVAAATVAPGIHLQGGF